MPSRASVSLTTTSQPKISRSMPSPGVLLPGQRGAAAGERLARVLQEQPLHLEHFAPSDRAGAPVHPQLDQQLAAVGAAEDHQRLTEGVIELEVHNRRLEPAGPQLLQDPEAFEDELDPDLREVLEEARVPRHAGEDAHQVVLGELPAAVPGGRGQAHRVEGGLDLAEAHQGELFVVRGLDRRPGEEPGEKPRRVAPRRVAVASPRAPPRARACDGARGPRRTGRARRRLRP